MDLISRPEAWSARIDDSRPEPGPLTLTSTVRTPCSRAAVAHACAAICAANGVPLREPLNPQRPALDQDSRLPCGSAIATTVLLKVAWTWAIADGMFFFSFFFPPGFLAPGFPFAIRSFPFPYFFASAFFLPAMATRGPFLVLALVCVRWPLHGSPRRCRCPR